MSLAFLLRGVPPVPAPGAFSLGGGVGSGKWAYIFWSTHFADLLLAQKFQNALQVKIFCLLTLLTFYKHFYSSEQSPD